MKKIFKEFAAFINKGNALALAIGVIIGGAFTGIVNAINTKIISPLIGTLLGDYDLSNSLVTILDYKLDANGNKVLDEAGLPIIENAIYWGAFIQSVIDFLLTAVILFAIFKVVMSISAAAKRARERVQDLLDGEEEVAQAPAEPAPLPEPIVPEDILLLKEIRDLLSANAKKDE